MIVFVCYCLFLVRYQCGRNNYRKAVVEGEEVDPAMDKLVKSLTQHTPTSPQPTSMFLREAYCSTLHVVTKATINVVIRQ